MKEYLKRSKLFFICFIVCLCSFFIHKNELEKQKYIYCGVIVDKYPLPFSRYKSTSIYYKKFYVLKNSNQYKEVQLDTFHNLGDNICVTIYNDRSILDIVLTIVFFTSLIIGILCFMYIFLK